MHTYAMRYCVSCGMLHKIPTTLDQDAWFCGVCGRVTQHVGFAVLVWLYPLRALIVR